MNYLDKLKLHPYVSENVSVEVYETPFKHIIINNFFKPQVYQGLSKKFPEYISKVNSPLGQVGDNPNHVYEAIIYGFQQDDFVLGYDFFINLFWKNYLSEIFNVVLNPHVVCSAHFHKGSETSPSKSGWVHQDLNICSAVDDPSKEIKHIHDCNYPDDTNGQPHTKKIIRSIACLFYLNNPENLSEKDGGGTGIFEDYDTKSLLKNVLPTNNKLLAFEISPISYHAFIGSKFNRSAMVQWFHSDPAYYVNKHLFKFKEQWHKNKTIFESWNKENVWNLEKDPDYSKYFDKPIAQILSDKNTWYTI